MREEGTHPALPALSSVEYEQRRTVVAEPSFSVPPVALEPYR